MRVVEVVSGSGGGGKGSLEVGPHICCKGSDVGVGVGSGEASGARDRNSCMWKREKESAIELSTPGMCLAVMWKFCMAASSMRFRRRCMICGQWLVPEAMQ